MKIQSGKCGDPFQLTAAKGTMSVTLRMAGPVGGCGDEGFDGGKLPPGFLREEVGDEVFPDVFDGLRRRVDEVFGVETVVAQVVGENLEGRIVTYGRETFGEFRGGQAQHGLAQGVAGESVGQVPHGADGQQDLFSGEGTLEQPGIGPDNLPDTQAPADEFRGGSPVAVGHHLAVVLENPCRAEGEDHAVGPAERLGASLPGVVHPPQGFVGIRGREVAVESEVVPCLAVGAELFAVDGRSVGIAVDRRSDRQGVEEYPRGICCDVELCPGKAFGDGYGEAGAERQQAVFVSEGRAGGRRLDFGAEFHTAKIEISYLCFMILKANCKINLGLDILRRRPDGYHDLETVMVPVAGLYDLIEMTPAAGRDVEFVQQGIAVDCPPEANICLRAWALMRDRYGVGGVRIRLDKRVPFGAGLGGGSSDGTAVVMALNELFGLRLPEEELIARAAELGSDTAFFVRNTPQLCTGRGEVMAPFALDLRGLTLVVIKPSEGVSTREAYAGVRPRVPEVSLAERLRRPVGEWQASVTNDFEASVFAAHPAIRAVKERLLAAGALYASMSGSGSAVFGLFDGPAPEIGLCDGEFLHRETIGSSE